MNSEKAIIEKLKKLSDQQQKEVLDFVESLQENNFKSSSEEPKKKKYDLNDLLAKVTSENLHEEIESGLAIGREIG